MKYFLIYTFLLLTAFAAGAQERFVSPQKNFEATFISKPEYMNQNIETADTTLRLHIFTAVSADSKHVYMVSYATYPKSTLSDKTTHKSFMQSAAGDFFSDMNIVSAAPSDIRQKKYSGLEYTGANAQYAISLRLYIAGSTMYQICVLDDASGADSKATEAFFKSFKITQ